MLNSFKMPETPMFRDDASKISDESFSTAYDQPKIPQRQLRRRSTVTTLKRWASKRVSRASLNDTQGNELSEKNLLSLDHETRYLGNNHNATTKDLDLSEMDEGRELKNRNGSIQEVAETLPNHDLQEDRDPYLLQEYDAFCHEFTLSGSHGTQRDFDLSMEGDSNGSTTCKSKINHTLTSPLAEESGSPFNNFGYQANISQPQLIDSKVENIAPQTQSTTSMYPGRPPTNHDNSKIPGKETEYTVSSVYQPQPPSHVMTPLVYMEMQRATRERRLSRQKSHWQPLRSLFSNESLNRQ